MRLVISKKTYNREINILIVDDSKDDVDKLVNVMTQANQQLHFNMKIDVIKDPKDLILIYHIYQHYN